MSHSLGRPYIPALCRPRTPTDTDALPASAMPPWDAASLVARCLRKAESSEWSNRSDVWRLTHGTGGVIRSGEHQNRNFSHPDVQLVLLLAVY